jgi:sugar O-acyltransferase (sialic acid O-acetyltransferase NeuD family)|tara:strand:- start:91 stop:735 length:645 start_codon:yes stop_codon:yes gene_type:complete
MIRDIAIIGKGGFGREVRFLIDEINKVKSTYNFLGYFDDDTEKPVDGLPLIGNLDDLKHYSKKICISVAIGSSSLRKSMIDSLSENTNIEYPNLFHPNVQMDVKHVSFGLGNIICSGNILTTNIFVGDFLILNLCCTLGHDVIIGNYCSVMPGVSISGNVTIGEECFIGTGCKIINDKSVGDKVLLGAGCIVIKDIPNGAVAVGNPARVIKINE